MNALVILISSLLFMLSLSLWVNLRQKLKLLAEDKHASADTGVQNQLSALNAGSIGLGERLIKIQKEMQALLARVDDLQTQVQTNTPYAQAIQMIQRGDTASDIVEVCNISFNEVQLLIKLHQQDKAA